jgi:hypothetical protein
VRDWGRAGDDQTCGIFVHKHRKWGYTAAP